MGNCMRIDQICHKNDSQQKDSKKPLSSRLPNPSNYKTLKIFLEKEYIRARKPKQKIIYEKIKLINGDSKIYQDNDCCQLQGGRGQMPDDRIQIKNPLQYPYSTIGYIRAFKGGSDHACGTGTLIGPNLVLTVAHNVRYNRTQVEKLGIYQDWNQYAKREAYFYLGVNGRISRAARQIKVRSMHFLEEFQQLSTEKTEKIDYAILVLDTDEDLTQQFGSMGINTFWKNQNQKVNIFGYPEDRIRTKKELQGIPQIQQCGFLFGNSGIVDIEKQQRGLRYVMHTSGGQSGSAIFISEKNGQCDIVGIHRGKLYNTTNIGIKINEEVRQNINKWLAPISSTMQFIKWRQQHIKYQESYQQNIKEQFKKGKQQYENKNYQEAIKWLKQAINTGEQNAQQYNMLGKSYNMLEKDKEAINYYQTAIKINPKFDQAYSNLGFTYSRLGKFKEAIQCCKKATQINPENGLAYSNLGFAYFNRTQTEQAIQSCLKAIEINEKDYDAYHNLGQAYQYNQKFAQALECIKKCQQNQPQSKYYQKKVISLKNRI